jgi:hypothetical protein
MPRTATDEPVAHAITRPRLVALVAALSVLGVLVAVALGGRADESGGSRSGGPPSGLRIEASSGDTSMDLTIYVEDRAVNRPETTHGSTEVTVECLDRARAVQFQTRQPWPFTGTDGGTNLPHVHIQLDPAVLDQIVSCRLKDTDPALGGRRL